MQHTVKSELCFEGVGLHGNQPVSVRVKPGRINTGIVFVRSDLNNAILSAHWTAVQQMPLCTTIRSGDVTLSTIEHLMAAFVGCGVDNALVEVSASEMPILDGSAKPYVDAIVKAGLKRQEAPRQIFEILREVSVKDGDKFARFEPGNQARFHFSIDFESKAIGRQDYLYTHNNMHEFVTNIAPARSFAQKRDVEMAQAAGQALGATMKSGILVDGDQVVNPEGLRFDDEFVRHKVLDAMGDLALAGGSVIGTFICHKGGHSLTNQLLHKVFSDPDNYRIAHDYLGLHDHEGIPAIQNNAVAQAILQRPGISA